MKSGRGIDIDERAGKSFFGLPSRPDRSKSDDKTNISSSKRKSFFGMPSLEGRSIVDVDGENGVDMAKRKSFLGMPWRGTRSDTAVVDEPSSDGYYGFPNSVTSTDFVERSSKSFFGIPSEVGRSIDSEKRAGKSFFGMPSRPTRAHHDKLAEKRKSFFGIPAQFGRSTADNSIEITERKSFFGIPSPHGRSVVDVSLDDKAPAYYPAVVEERSSKSFFGMPKMAGRSQESPDTFQSGSSVDIGNDNLEKKGGRRRKAFPGMPYLVSFNQEKRSNDADLDSHERDADLDSHERDRRSPETTLLEDNQNKGQEFEDQNEVTKKSNLARLYTRGKLYPGMPLAAVNRSDRYRPHPKKSSTQVQEYPTDKNEMVEKRAGVRRKVFAGMPTAFRRARPNHNSAAITGKLFMGMPVPEY
ncbi:uncharacterized protein [Ptychodera flava]|uniref:uncharacterized protein n=1 Tax=Ptychodera flava TaxID=63121 RepID=UPI00396A9399